MDKQPNVNIYDDREALARALWTRVVSLAETAFAVQGRFCVALSGGSLLEIISTALDSHRSSGTVDWSTWHIFWTDERWVPWKNSESNFGLAKTRFFSRIRISPEQIHAMDTTLSPDETAKAYESTLTKIFQPNVGQLPRFDLMLLGIGEDGHTASLFPGHPALNETRYWIVPVSNVPKPPPIRITMTLPLINNAGHVFFVAFGPSKAAIVAKILDPKSQSQELPAGLVKPSNGALSWFIDRTAAAKLHHRQAKQIQR